MCQQEIIASPQFFFVKLITSVDCNRYADPIMRTLIAITGAKEFPDRTTELEASSLERSRRVSPTFFFVKLITYVAAAICMLMQSSVQADRDHQTKESPDCAILGTILFSSFKRHRFLKATTKHCFGLSLKFSVSSSALMLLSPQ